MMEESSQRMMGSGTGTCCSGGVAGFGLLVCSARSMVYSRSTSCAVFDISSPAGFLRNTHLVPLLKVSSAGEGESDTLGIGEKVCWIGLERVNNHDAHGACRIPVHTGGTVSTRTNARLVRTL